MINIENLVKRYNGKAVINDMSLYVDCGEIVGLIGPSGSGKSTVLRCINGLEKYDSGRIHIDIEAPYEIGTVFQQFNLFKNMTVLQNLNYPQMTALNKTEDEANGMSMSMLKKVGLVHLIDRYPINLSGGQKQRIAIARSLCMEPKIMLFDEPTSSLDPENIIEVLTLIKSIATSSNMTMIIVTHEMRFAKASTSRIVFMENGSIVENMKTERFFNTPSNKRVEQFLGKLLFNA